MKEKTFDEKWDKVVLLLSIGAALFMGGYLAGRFTAISDLQKGNLYDFIPNKI